MDVDSLLVEADATASDGARVHASARAAPLLVWSAIVVLGAFLVHVVLVATGEKRLNGVPLHAAFSPAFSCNTLIPVVVLVAVVYGAPRARAMRWPVLLCTWWLVAAVWALALALTRGPHRVVAPLQRAGDYTAVLPRIESVGIFLETFVDRIGTFPIHVQGHPPGLPLVELALQRTGVGGSVPLAVLIVAIGAAAVPLVLVSVREVVDEAWARRAAPFLAIGPAAVWIATSADAVFAGVGAAAVAFVVLATGARGTRRASLAVAGGIFFGACAFLSYGLVLLALVPLVIAIERRSLDVVVLAVVGAAPVFVGFAAAGFWWVDGLSATHDRYYAGIASRRPYELFLVANVAILAIAVGPAIAVALWRLRSRACWLLVGSALGALALANLSGMSKSEVERIWLPFVPFVVVAAGVFRCRPRTARPVSFPNLGGTGAWLALQGCAAILVESLVRTAW